MYIIMSTFEYLPFNLITLSLFTWLFPLYKILSHVPVALSCLNNVRSISSFNPSHPKSLNNWLPLCPFQCQMKLQVLASHFTVNESSIIWIVDHSFIIFTQFQLAKSRLLGFFNPEITHLNALSITFKWNNLTKTSGDLIILHPNPIIVPISIPSEKIHIENPRKTSLSKEKGASVHSLENRLSYINI